MSEWKELKKEIEATLNEEEENPLIEQDISLGWIEALNYVLKRMNFYENKNEEE